MKKRIALTVFLIGLALAFLPTFSDAGRFGGGRSFGSRPSYSRSFKAPSSAPSRPNTPATSPFRGRGMFGGLLGGMLMGGLLGSLFFGGPFTGPSFIDILLIGGGIFLLLRFLRSRQPAMQPPTTMPSGRDMSADAWGGFRSGPEQANTAANLPPGFDAQEFLTGAKAAYSRLQNSWDKRDLEDLRQFLSPEMFMEIQGQAQADPNPGTTEIVRLEAQLLEVKVVGNQTIATVLFDALLREDSPTAPAQQTREAWHFSRYEHSGDTHWVVEGLQQLDT